jgi:hypothetical protein
MRYYYLAKSPLLRGKALVRSCHFHPSTSRRCSSSRRSRATTSSYWNSSRDGRTIPIFFPSTRPRGRDRYREDEEEGRSRRRPKMRIVVPPPRRRKKKKTPPSSRYNFRSMISPGSIFPCTSWMMILPSSCRLPFRSWGSTRRSRGAEYCSFSACLG